MPRIRSIKPQFWIDERLGSICRDARLLYIGLWNLADDQGVFEYRPARIKAQLFPYDSDIKSDTISQWLSMLEETGDIKQFSNNGEIFGYIPSFKKHQPIEKPSKWIFAEIPTELRSIKHDNDTTTPQPVGDYSPTTSQPLSLGNREKEKGIGSKESNNKSKALIPLKITELVTKIDDKSVTIDMDRGDKVKQVFSCLDKLRGYRPPKRKAEAISIIRMLKEYTPNQIIETWQILKRDTFWSDKELYMMSVESQIGACMNGTHRGNNGQNGESNSNLGKDKTGSTDPSKFITGKYGQYVQH